MNLLSSIFSIIRYKNLVMIIITQYVIRYGFFPALAIDLRLSDLQFLLLVAATVFIAAGGYIINDIYDIVADAINKPKRQVVGISIKEKVALRIYVLCTLIGLICGLLLVHSIGRSTLFTLFICIAVALHVYASMLKPRLLLGSITIALFIAMVILIVGLFELLPQAGIPITPQQKLAWRLLLDFAIFAAVLNFIRELVKDLEDIKGDYKANYKTLPIVLGMQRTTRFTSMLTAFSLFGFALYLFTYVTETWMLITFVAVILAPMIYVCTRLWDATRKQEFSRLSLIIKCIMVAGIALLPFLTQILRYAR